MLINIHFNYIYTILYYRVKTFLTMLLIYPGFLVVLLIPVMYCQRIYELLDSLKFLNEGSISSSDVYQYQYEHAMYTEPENVTQEKHSWIEGGVRPYLYQIDPSEPAQCSANPFLNGTDLPGADFLSVIPSVADPSSCVTLCCAQLSCVAWSYAASAPSEFKDCHTGQACCYLKTYVPDFHPNSEIISATMNRTSPYHHPPSGLRSSVPLGGITTGSIELRGDGTFHEWTVESQSPAGGAKYGVVGDALLAIRLKNLIK